MSSTTNFPRSYLRFKPTYKEWKHAWLVLLAGILMRFKPTYKEWKHITVEKEFSDVEPVLSLPTRNGNCVQPF